MRRATNKTNKATPAPEHKPVRQRARRSRVSPKAVSKRHVVAHHKPRHGDTCAICGTAFKPGDRRPLLTVYDGVRMQGVLRHVCALCYADAARDYTSAERLGKGRLGALRPGSF